MVGQVSGEPVDFDSQISGEMVPGCLTQQQPKMNWVVAQMKQEEEEQQDHDFDCYYQAEVPVEDVLVMEMLGPNTSLAEAEFDWVAKPCIALMVAQNFELNQYTSLDFAQNW